MTEVTTADAGQSAATTFAIPALESSTPSPLPTTNATPAAPSGFTVPEQYKGEIWAKKIVESANPQDAIWNEFANVQKLIGTRPQGLTVPGAEATPEQVKEFHKAIGVPESIDDYKVDPIEWSEEDKPLAESLDMKNNEAFMTELKTLAKEIGLTPKQFNALAQGYDKAFLTHNKDFVAEQRETQKKLEMDFDTRAKAMLGDKMNAVLESGNKLLESLGLSKEVWSLLKEPGSGSVLGVAMVLDAVKQKYIQEDKFIQTNATPSISPEEARREGVAMMAQLEQIKNPFGPEYNALKAKIDRHYETHFSNR